VKIIKLQRPAVCKSCEVEIPAGANARYYSPDAIYCENHQKDAMGHDVPNVYKNTPPPVQTPLETAPTSIQPMLESAVMYNELVRQLAALTESIHWQTEKTALATDFLNTICILMRQNQEVRNDQTHALNLVQPETVSTSAKKHTRSHTIS